MTLESTRPIPHPVAALLNDEQRARVAAATFVLLDRKTRIRNVAAKLQCPLGVALNLPGWPAPSADKVCDVLGVSRYSEAGRAVADFIIRADSGRIQSTNVHALLGCAEVTS